MCQRHKTQEKVKGLKSCKKKKKPVNFEQAPEILNKTSSLKNSGMLMPVITYMVKTEPLHSQLLQLW